MPRPVHTRLTSQELGGACSAFVPARHCVTHDLTRDELSDFSPFRSLSPWVFHCLFYLRIYSPFFVTIGTSRFRCTPSPRWNLNVQSEIRELTTLVSGYTLGTTPVRPRPSRYDPPADVWVTDVPTFISAIVTDCS